ncbi:BadF/BadG/BcrA/BcrD ATPase family protein [Neobacillus sp. SCS-31]|uniref:BadF/BadG/BcrA/BcrD ATPase family protein n=1 Tax=Neobacillus oceani TaxID=3115292 RepID=UPI00390679B6
MNKGIVIGIDGGGTFTRVAIADMNGHLLAFSKKAGSHPEKNQDPEGNVKSAITEALQKANRQAADVHYIAGGFAGLDHSEDKKWANKYTTLSGLNAPKSLLNDAEIAQYGAFLGEEGIIAIAGTGSIVLGKNEDGKVIRNYDFHHDSLAGARYLSYEAIYDIITQENTQEDQKFIKAVLEYWGTENIDALRLQASQGFLNNHIEAVQKLSKMSSIVVHFAEKGSPVAYSSCHKVINSLARGINLVSSMFSSQKVPLSFSGGVITSPFMTNLMKQHLASSGQSKKEFLYKEPTLPPVLGAVLYAYNKLGISFDEPIVTSMKLSFKCE